MLESALVRPDAGWVLSLYPAAGEAGGSFVSSYRPGSSGRVRGEAAADPDRSRAEGGRRARRMVRRYCTANRLNRLGTLTYAGKGCHDPEQLRQDVAVFFRSLRAASGGKPFPYVWVPEWHKSDHGMHVHFAVGQFIPRRKIEQAWGHGFVSIKRLSDLPVGSTSLHEARKAAGYLSKYVSKDFTADLASRQASLHRYEVAEGFQPVAHQLHGRSRASVLEQACAVMGARPSLSWYSENAEGWQGPPAMWFAWD